MAENWVKWVKDIEKMHEKFGVHDWVNKNKNDKEKLKRFLDFRVAFLKEELNEIEKAIFDKEPAEVVDGLIDLCVVAIGTLDAFEVDSKKAWNRVHEANMSKEPGVKPSRPNPLGLPDLIKPEGWKAPQHHDNTGNIPDAL